MQYSCVALLCPLLCGCFYLPQGSPWPPLPGGQLIQLLWLELTPPPLALCLPEMSVRCRLPLSCLRWLRRGRVGWVGMGWVIVGWVVWV